MVRLIPLSKSEFDAYLQEDIARYARENVRAELWDAAEALEKSKRAHEQLLPRGHRTPNHFFYSVVRENGEKVGVIWVAIHTSAKPPSCFIYDLFIQEKYRRKGYATLALRAIEARLRRKNIRALKLHVFEHNEPAKHLYARAGFTGKRMLKKHIAPPSR